MSGPSTLQTTIQAGKDAGPALLPGALSGAPIRPQRLKQYTRAVASNSIDLEAGSLITLMGELVTDGVLTAPRKVAIMTP